MWFHDFVQSQTGCCRAINKQCGNGYYQSGCWRVGGTVINKDKWMLLVKSPPRIFWSGRALCGWSYRQLALDRVCTPAGYKNKKILPFINSGNRWIFIIWGQTKGSRGSGIHVEMRTLFGFRGSSQLTGLGRMASGDFRKVQHHTRRG